MLFCALEQDRASVRDKQTVCLLLGVRQLRVTEACNGRAIQDSIYQLAIFGEKVFRSFHRSILEPGCSRHGLIAASSELGQHDWFVLALVPLPLLLVIPSGGFSGSLRQVDVMNHVPTEEFPIYLGTFIIKIRQDVVIQENFQIVFTLLPKFNLSFTIFQLNTIEMEHALMLSWFFPEQLVLPPELSSRDIVEALQSLLEAQDGDSFYELVSRQAGILLSQHTQTVLYLTLLRESLSEEEDPVVEDLRFFLYLLRYASVHDIAQAFECLAFLTEETDITLLFPLVATDWLAFLKQVRAAFKPEQHLPVFALLCQETGDLQTQLYDETGDETFIQQACENYTQALSCVAQQEKPAFGAYLHLRRGLTFLHRKEGERAELLEQAIADFEAALPILSPTEQPEYAGTLHFNLAVAYCERVYGTREKNLRRAIEAYRAALDIYTQETAQHMVSDINYRLAFIYVELKDEQAARAAFSALGEAARLVERMAQEQLKENEPATAAARTEPADDEQLASIIDNWLALVDRDQLHAYLLEHQDWLISNTAIRALRRRLEAIEQQRRDGYAEYIAMLLRLLEDAMATSLDLAWHRYFIELLPALEAILMLSFASSTQEVQHRIMEQQVTFTSPTMFAVLYMIAHAPDQNELEADSLRAVATLLHMVRSGEIASPALATASATESLSVNTQENDAHGAEDELRSSFSFSQRDFERVNLNDPVFRLLAQDLSRLTPEQRMAILPYLAQIGNIIGSSRFSEMEQGARNIAALLDPLQTPYLVAGMRWNCAASSLIDPQQADLPQALEDCEAALSVFTREISPNAWGILIFTRAVIHFNMIAYDTQRRLIQAEREYHARQAFTDFNTIENFFSPQETAYEWALVRATRAMARIEMGGQNAQEHLDIEGILADFDAALPVLKSEATQMQCIFLHMYRARMLLEYQVGDRRVHIERAIEDCNAVIALAQPRSTRAMEDFWVGALIVRGIAYLERISGRARENIEQAIQDFNLALTVYTRASYPQDWAVTLANRAHAYLVRIEGDRRSNLELALKDCQDALEELRSREDYSMTGQVLVNRSHIYLQRIAGERTQNLQDALAGCNEAIELFVKAGQDYQRARALVNRAGIYMLLLSGDRRHNFELALADCNAALEVLSPATFPLDWGKTLVNRGMVRRSLAMMYGFRQRGAGMRTLMNRLLTQDEESIYVQFGEIDVLFEQALSDFTQALTVFSRDVTPREWASTLRERALTYGVQTQSFFSGKREEYLRLGIFDYDSALNVLAEQEWPYDWAITITNRGVLYSELVSLPSTTQSEDAAHALADTEAAMSVLTRQTSPANYRTLQSIRAGVFAKLRQWSRVHDALSEARAVQRDLTAKTSSPQAQIDTIAAFSLLDIYVLDAWALLHIEPVDVEAIAVALEEGRAQSQRVALELDMIRMQDLPPGEARERMRAFLLARDQWRKAQAQALEQGLTANAQRNINVAYHAFIQARERIRELDNADFMSPRPSLQGITQALQEPGEALVYLVPASMLAETGGMALIVTRTPSHEIIATPLHISALQEFDLLDLIEIRNNDSPLIRWNEVIETLGQKGLDIVVERLLQQGVRKVRLIPFSWLGLFPLPSVMITTPDGRCRCLSDLFEEVTIVPGARSLEVARERILRFSRERRTLLIGGNPTPHPPGADLPFAHAEAATIKRIAREHGYPSTLIHYLPPGEMTRERVIDELQKAYYAHLALHGQYRVGDPRHSRIVLAGSEWLAERERSIYLGEVLDGHIRLKGMRLLVLSACETSIIDTQRVPNEALGLSAAFLQAGTAAVIATLWPVHDVATYLLMTRFAHYFLDPQGLWPPARALARAQRWLREEATNRVLAEYDPISGNSTLRSLRLSYAAARLNIQREALDGDPDALPFADPFFWAGVVVMGI